MSKVWGVVLDDDRRVAVKVRGDGSRIRVASVAQEAAIARGIDCPRVLAGPEPLADGAHSWITVEEWRGEGDVEPPGDPAERYGFLLAEVNSALRTVPMPVLAPPPWLDYDHGDPLRVWPPPASDRWDPHRIEAQMPAELVDIARAARARLVAADLPIAFQNGDLNPANVRWVTTDGNTRALVHDWDSVIVAPEAVVAGEVAADIMMLPGRERFADVDTGARVLASFEKARGALLTAEEMEVAWATTAWLGAYNATFEHLHGAAGPISAQILADGRERLRLSGG